MRLTSILKVLGRAIGISSCQQGNQVKIDEAETASDPKELSGKKNYANPADGKVYASDQEWKRYSPADPVVQTGAIKMEQVILLTEQGKIPTLIGVERLAEFIKKAEALVKESMEGSEKEGEMLVQVTLKEKASPGVDISLTEHVDEQKASLIYASIASLSEYRTTRDSCAFQLHFTINK